MKESNAEQQPADDLDEDEVAAFLRARPDFLQRHPDVLDSVELRHEAGRAVSLIERQVASLRQGKQQTQGKLQELIATARDNELRVQHLNGLARVLIEAESADALVQGLRAFLRRELMVDALFIGVVGATEADAGGIRTIARDGAEMDVLTNVFRRGKPMCGPLSEAQARTLFAATGDTPPQSAAMIPLGEGNVRGAIALGSRDSKRFVPEMGTMFLELMGALVTAACRRHLGPRAL